MGQYFTIYNHSRGEYLNPTNGLKALECVTTPLNGSMLLYLLTDLPDSLDPAEKSGLWINDEIRIQGDYHPSDVKQKTKTTHIIKYNDKNVETTYNIQGPINIDKSSFDFGETFSSYRTINEGSNRINPLTGPSVYFESQQISKGDPVIIDKTYIDDIEGDKHTFATYIDEKEPEFTDITESTKRAVKQVIQDSEWIESQYDATLYRPDMKITPNGEKSFKLTSTPHTITPAEASPSASEPTRLGGSQADYIIINYSKQEYVIPDNTQSIQKTLTNPVTNGMLQYLLFNSVQNSSRFTGLHNPNAPELEDEIKSKKQKERKRWLNKGRSSAYRNDDNGWNKNKLVRAITANHMISEDYLYAGKWQGDNIEMVKKTSSKVKPILENNSYYDITDRLLSAYEVFVTKGWIQQYQSMTAEPPTSQHDITAFTSEV